MGSSKVSLEGFCDNDYGKNNLAKFGYILEDMKVGPQKKKKKEKSFY